MTSFVADLPPGVDYVVLEDKVIVSSSLSDKERSNIINFLIEVNVSERELLQARL